MRAVNQYLYEGGSWNALGFYQRHIQCFVDSGFHFRQIEDMPRKLEVGFHAI